MATPAKIRAPKPVKRYTHLPSLLDILVHKRLTLVSYTTWKDVNDRRSMQAFQELNKHAFLGAICLTDAPETFHHWQIFAGDSAGVCVSLNRGKLSSAVAAHGNCDFGPMKYLRYEDLDNIDEADIGALPFMKRAGFRDEQELRVVGWGTVPDTPIHLTIEPDMVERVTFSPFIPPQLFETAQGVIKGLEGWAQLSVTKSGLTDSTTWRRKIGKFASSPKKI